MVVVGDSGHVFALFFRLDLHSSVGVSLMWLMMMMMMMTAIAVFSIIAIAMIVVGILTSISIIIKKAQTQRLQNPLFKLRNIPYITSGFLF